MFVTFGYARFSVFLSRMVHIALNVTEVIRYLSLNVIGF
jgi:hypothetical protein